MGLTQLFTVAGFTMDVGLNSGIMDVTPNIPQKFMSGYMTRGLYGNFDGDPQNDFQLPNGTILSNNLTEQEIYQYGESCKFSMIFLSNMSYATCILRS